MRRIVLALVLVAVAVTILGAGGYSAAWLVTARAAEAAVAEWADARRADGYAVVVGHLSVGGFPTEIVVDIREIELAGSDGPLPWRWRIERVVGEGRFGNPAATVLVLGPQRLTYTAAGEERVLRATASRFAVDVRWAEHRIDSVYADIRGLTVERSEQEPLTARRIQVRAAPGDGPGLVPDDTRFAVSFDTLVLPEHRRGPLGDTLAMLRAEGRVRGALLLAHDLPGTLADWRERGGLVALASSEVRWGTLDMRSAGGLFRLDEGFRPAGGFDAQVRGYLITIDAFHAAGLLSQEAMDDIRSLLAFLRDQGRGGGGGAIGLPVRVQDGRVSVGRAELGGVPRLLPVVD